MSDRLRFTILGCGSSPGTPRITGDWGRCDPTNPRNRRLRASALVERIAQNGATTAVVIDTGPDFREQMLTVKVHRLDAVVYTHPHADHIHGIDDLRGYVLEQRRRMEIHADAYTQKRLHDSFGYCFETPVGSSYPPMLTPNLIDHGEAVVVEGEGGSLAFQPLPLAHGEITALGFRIGPIAYCPDVSAIPDATLALMTGLETLVINALQYEPHPSHLTLSQALGYIERLAPRNAVLTHLHVPLDYETVMRETPGNVVPAHDGMVMDFRMDSI